MAVIPPIVVEKFTCSGNGLLYEGYARESPANLRAMIVGRSHINDKDKPKSWWLAQTLLYGLPGNKSSTIGQLRERLQTTLQEPGGMVVPEKILNMEVDANKEFNQLNAQITLKTQPSTSKGKAKVVDDPPAPKSSQSKAPAKGKERPKLAAKSTSVPSKTKAKAKATSDGKKPPAIPIPSGSTKRGARVRQPIRKAAGDRPPMKREREDEMEVELGPKYEEWEDTHPEQGPPRKRARHEQPTGPFAWLSGTYQIEAPVISQGWGVGENFTLIVSIPRLTPHLLLVEFDFGVVHGIMRSRAPIVTRADGAYATFEWCGQDGEGVIKYHRPCMTGYLKFVRRMDGAHTVRGKAQDLPFVGDAEFDGIWTSPDTSIHSEWGDFSQTAYEYAIAARWG